MVTRSKLQQDLDQIALVLSTAGTALQAGRYNQANGLILNALEGIAGVGRVVRELEDELTRTREAVAS